MTDDEKKAYQKEYRLRNKETSRGYSRVYSKKPESRQYQKEYRIKNKEKIRVQRAHYYEKNRDQLNAKRKAEYVPGSLKEYSSAYYKRNKDKARVSGRIYRDQNKELIKDRDKKWRTKNADKLRQKRQTVTARYNFLKAAAKRRNRLTDILTEDQYTFLVTNESCVYCTGELPLTGHGLDRIDNSLFYSVDNVVPCCTNCNKFRSNLLTVDETRELIKQLAEIRDVPLSQVWLPKKIST